MLNVQIEFLIVLGLSRNCILGVDLLEKFKSSGDLHNKRITFAGIEGRPSWKLINENGKDVEDKSQEEIVREHYNTTQEALQTKDANAVTVKEDMREGEREGEVYHDKQTKNEDKIEKERKTQRRKRGRKRRASSNSQGPRTREKI